MWQAFTEFPDYLSQVRIFRDLASALQWLNLKTLPPSIRLESSRIVSHESMSAELEES